ncbi:MAG: ComEA family DNA-binding protein [Mangrovibacterium sp.]
MKPWQKIIQSFLLTRGEQAGSMILLACIVIMMYINLNIGKSEPDIPLVASKEFKQLLHQRDSLQKANQKYLYEFNPNTADSSSLAKLKLPEYIKRNLIHYRERGGRYRKKSDVLRLYGMNDSIFQSISPYIVIEAEKKKDRIVLKENNIEPHLFVFNPNSITLKQLDSLGLPNIIKANLIKYRTHGGHFKTKEDFRKLYGMSPDIFQQISPYICIPNDVKTPKQPINHKMDIELNNTTAEELRLLKDIGGKLSERIIKYRNLLGGYANPEQLYMVYGMSAETVSRNLPYLRCDVEQIKRIRINFASYNDLVKHPLISSEKAKQIIKNRAQIGKFNSIQELNGVIFTDNECKLLQYYLEY